MAVEVARLGRKRFENVGGIDSAEVEDSVRRRSIILIMQPVGSCSSDDRGCHHCQTQCDRSIHCVFPLAFVKLFITWVPTAAAIRNLARLFGAVSCLPMAPALPVMRAGTSIRPLFWAALGRAAARHYVCICGTDSKAQWCSENLLRN